MYVNEDCINFEISAVKHSISKLKAGKHDGFDGLSSDFILNGTEFLDDHVSFLFTIMLSHCYVLVSFYISTMIPIPKGSGSVGDIKYYRALLLVACCLSYLIHPQLSKLFDACVISSQFDCFYSNDLLQFVYKSQASIIQCVSSVNETITYYVDHVGNVYIV